MIRCNNCYETWDDDEMLPQIRVFEDEDVEGEVIKGCDTCKTDGYLMDLEVSHAV